MEKNNIWRNLYYNLDNKRMEDIILRKAVNSDIDSLVELRYKLLVKVNDIQNNNSGNKIKNEFCRYFKQHISNDSFISFIAEYKKKIIASSGLVLHYNPPTIKNFSGIEAYIMNIYTLPDWRRKGIVSKILKKLFDHIKQLNITTVWLKSSQAGIELYKKSGFSEDIHYTYMIKWI